MKWSVDRSSSVQLAGTLGVLACFIALLYISLFGAPVTWTTLIAVAGVVLAILLAGSAVANFYRTHQQLAISTASLQENQGLLQASEDHLALAIEAAQLGTWDWNLESGGVICSPQCEELFGIEPGSFAGTYEAFAQCVHPDDVAPLGQSLQAAMVGSDDWKRDFRIIHANGSIRWVTSTGKFIYKKNKKAVRAIGVVFDNTDRQQAEALLKQANTSLEQQVAERTVELKQANNRLQRELFARGLAEITLKQEADRQAALIATQFEIATAGLNLSQVMNLIVERSQQLTQADGAVIELAEGDEMVYRAASGHAASYVGLRLKISGSLSGHCLQTGELLRCDNAEIDPRVDQAACNRLGVRSMIVVPLQYDQRTLGVLKVLSAQNQAFDDKDTNTLLLMAGTLAAAIRYASEFETKQSLLTERTAALEQIQLLQMLTLTIAETQDINTALERVLEQVGRFQGWDYGEVWLPDSGKNILECQTVWCKRPEGRTFAQLSQLRTFKFPSGVGLPGRVWASQQPEWRIDVSTEPEAIFPRSRVAQASGVKTGVGVPLVLDNQVLAVLVFFKFEAAPENQQQIESLSTIAAQLSLVIRHKQAEEALRYSEAQFQSFMDNSPAISWITDRNGRILYLSQTYLRTLQVPETAIGKTVFELYPAEFAQQYLETIQSVADTNQAVEATETAPLTDGTTGTFLSYKFPIATPSGQCLIGGVAINITERKRTEIALQQSEAELCALFAAMSDVVLVRDAQGRCLKIAPTSTNGLTRDPSQMVGKTLHEVMPQAQADVIFCHIQQALELKHPVDCEYSLDVDDQQIWFAASISPLSSDSVVLVARNITDRKRAEAILQESEERYRSVIAAIAEGIVLQQADGRITACNASAERLLGLTADQMMGVSSVDPRWRAIHEDGSPFPGEEHPTMVTLQTGDSCSNTVMGVHKPDGTLTWILINAQPLFYPEESMPYAVVASFLDITDRKQSEQTIQQREQEFRSLAENSPDVIVRLDRAFRHLYANPKIEQATGLSPTAFIGKTYPELGFPKAIVTQWHSVVQQAFETAQEQTLEFEFPAPNGQMRQHYSRIVPEFSSDGEVNSVLIVTRDMTELKQAEALLREMSAALEYAVAGISKLDAQGRYLFANPAYAHATGYQPEEMVGMDWQRTVYPDDLESLVAAYHQMLREGKVEVEARGIRKDGSVFYKQLVMISLYDQQQQFVGHYCFMKDITDRKQMEELLRHKTAELEAIFRAIPDTIIFADVDRRIQSVNPAVTTLFGYQPEEVLGQKTEVLYASPEMYREMGRTRYHLTASEQLKPYEVTYRRMQGETFICETVGSVVRDSNDETIGFIGVIRDITERKQNEERLKLQSIILKNMTGGVCLVRVADWVIAYTNPKFESMFGYESGELNGQSISVVNYQDDHVNAAEVTHAIMTAIQTQGEATYEVHNVKKNGTPFWCQATASMFEHPEYGTVVVAVQYDITDRKLAEAALKQSEERLQLALEGSGDGLWDWNITTGYVHVSPRWLEMLGYEVGEMEVDVSVWGNLIHPEDQPWVMETLNAHLRDNSHPYAFDYRVLTKTGEWKWIGNYGKVVIRDQDGKPLRMTGTHKDISDRKRAEEELRKLNDKLQQSNQELQTFAYIASHDLKEPLRTVRNFCSLLQTKCGASLDQRGQDYIDRIQKATQRMQALIDDLLSLSRVTTEAKPLVPVNLAHIVCDVVATLDMQIQRTGGTVEIGELPTVSGDTIQLSQLFQNLISNALKFHRDIPPVVKIACIPAAHSHSLGKGQCYQILVEDNGIGFEEQYGERIFGTFERLHGRMEFEGTGMGLAICRKITERHGGTITAQSILREGSTFIVTLPTL